MTHLLQQAFDEASKLSEADQELFATWMLRELESERRWDEAFASSHEVLEQLSADALAEHRDGKTEVLDLKKL